jgi:hypothetical protein
MLPLYRTEIPRKMQLPIVFNQNFLEEEKEEKESEN